MLTDDGALLGRRGMMTSTMEDEKRKKKQSLDGRPRRAKFLYRPAIATFDGGGAARVYP